MDRESIEMLFSINLSTIKSFVQTMFDSLQNQVSDLKSENSALKHSLEFSQAEVLDLKTNLKEINENLNKQSKIVAVPSNVDDRVRALEDWTKRKNIRITGMTEISNENNEQTIHAVQKLIVNNLGESDVRVLKAYRVKSSSGSQPRHIVAELSSTEDKFKCFRQGKKLKNTDIYLNEDVSSSTLAIRKTKLAELKRKRSEGFIAYFSGVDIITRPRIQAHSDNAASNSMRQSSYSSVTQNDSLNVNLPSGSSASVVPPSRNTQNNPRQLRPNAGKKSSK